MRFCFYLLCLAPVLAYSASLFAHAPAHDSEKKVAWLCETPRLAHAAFYEAYGPRIICVVRHEERGSYLANRHNLTANDYDGVVVIYTIRDNRRQRHDHRGSGDNIAIGLAHQFSEHRLSEVTIEPLDQSRSRVIDVDDISGVALSYNTDYFGKKLDGSVLPKLGKEWQQRFPTDNGQVYKFSGSKIIFSDNNVLFHVYGVRRENGDYKEIHGLPPVLINKDYLID